MSKLDERIRKAFAEENARRANAGKPKLRKTDLWTEAKLSSGVVTHWFNGSSGMSLETAMIIAKLLNVDPYWLFDGRAPAPAPSGVVTLPPQARPQQRRLNEIAETISDEGLAMLVERALTLAELMPRAASEKSPLKQTA